MSTAKIFFWFRWQWHSSTQKIDLFWGRKNNSWHHSKPRSPNTNPFRTEWLFYSWWNLLGRVNFKQSQPGKSILDENFCFSSDLSRSKQRLRKVIDPFFIIKNNFPMLANPSAWWLWALRSDKFSLRRDENLENFLVPEASFKVLSQSV